MNNDTSFFIFDTDARVSHLLSIVHQPQESTIFTLDDEQVDLETPLIELVTDKNNPLCISPFIVDYTINEDFVQSIEYSAIVKCTRLLKGN